MNKCVDSHTPVESKVCQDQWVRNVCRLDQFQPEKDILYVLLSSLEETI